MAQLSYKYLMRLKVHVNDCNSFSSYINRSMLTYYAFPFYIVFHENVLRILNKFAYFVHQILKFVDFHFGLLRIAPGFLRQWSLWRPTTKSYNSNLKLQRELFKVWCVLFLIIHVIYTPTSFDKCAYINL